MQGQRGSGKAYLQGSSTRTVASGQHQCVGMENCVVQDMSQVGDGDQGKWPTCCAFAVCGAIRQVVRHKYGIFLQDTESMAAQLIGSGVRNGETDIFTAGISVRDLVDQLNKKMTAGFVFFADVGDLIKFNVTYSVLPWDKNVFSPDSCALGFVPKMFSTSSDCPNWIVTAAGGDGNHRHHAMRCKRLHFQENTVYLECSNSWGGAQRKMNVPNVTRYPHITNVYILDVNDVQVRTDPLSGWSRAERQGFMIQIKPSLTYFEHIMKCNGCGMLLLRKVTCFYAKDYYWLSLPVTARRLYEEPVRTCPKCRHRFSFVPKTSEQKWPLMLTKEHCSLVRSLTVKHMQ